MDSGLFHTWPYGNVRYLPTWQVSTVCSKYSVHVVTTSASYSGVPAILTDVYHGFPQSHQENSGLVP